VTMSGGFTSIHGGTLVISLGCLLGLWLLFFVLFNLFYQRYVVFRICLNRFSRAALLIKWTEASLGKEETGEYLNFKLRDLVWHEESRPYLGMN
jgi:hypothetical protein